MSDWTRSDTADGNGYYWNLQTGDHTDDCNGGDECTCDISYISAWEETVDGATQWYAWLGDYPSHDTATPTGLYPTRDEAVAALPEAN